MDVKVVGLTCPVVEGVQNPQQLLAYCARVSSTANQHNHATGAKLIRSLIRRREWSPLEMLSATLEIKTTRDISHQIIRHRSFAYQEFSTRYAKVDKPLVVRECRLQHPTDRQASVPCDDPDLSLWWESAQCEIHEAALRRYREALERGVAKEQARGLLPEGAVPTQLYMAGTLRSWYHYIELRADPKTQKEHRLIAAACRPALARWFPDLFGDAEDADQRIDPEPSLWAVKLDRD